MGEQTISEAQFLLTELRYTLGQLHVQVLDLDADARGQEQHEGRSIDGILDEMLGEEDGYQQRYRTLLGRTGAPGDEEANPLPVSESDTPPTLESRFEHKRAETIALLQHAGETWSSDLLEAVKEQVQKDRTHTTEIAECRKAFFERDQRPDLNEPLTTHPAPHVEAT